MEFVAKSTVGNVDWASLEPPPKRYQKRAPPQMTMTSTQNPEEHRLHMTLSSIAYMSRVITSSFFDSMFIRLRSYIKDINISNDRHYKFSDLFCYV